MWGKSKRIIIVKKTHGVINMVERNDIIMLANSVESIAESLKEISSELTDIRRSHESFVGEYISAMRSAKRSHHFEDKGE